MKRKKFYNKLVRDYIPDIIRQQGRVPNYRRLSPMEREQALLAKLVEEVNELRNAETREEVIEELADIQTVLAFIRGEYGLRYAEVYKRQLEKDKTNGRYLYGYYLESVEIPDKID